MFLSDVWGDQVGLDNLFGDDVPDVVIVVALENDRTINHDIVRRKSISEIVWADRIGVPTKSPKSQENEKPNTDDKKYDTNSKSSFIVGNFHKRPPKVKEQGDCIL